MVIFLCVLISIVSAMIGSIVGLGGGAILVPSLLVLYEFNQMFSWANPHSVVGISLVVMVFTALSSSISYYKKDRIDIKSGFLFVIGSIPGGVFGSWLNQYVDADTFSLLFGLLLLVLFLVFFVKDRITTVETNSHSRWNISRTLMIHGEIHTYSFSTVRALSIAFFIGILSGLFGIGGGSLMVPAMILLFSFPAHIATATSMFMILFLSLISSFTHVLLGHIQWEYVWLFIPGAWFGGTIGARINQKLNGKTVEWILRVLLIVIGVRLIWQGIG